MKLRIRRSGMVVVLVLLTMILVTAVVQSDVSEDSYTFLPVISSPPLPYPTWINKYEGNSWDSAHEVIATADNGYLAVGQTASSQYPGLVLKVDQDGQIVWQKAHQIGGPFTDVAEAGDGSLLLVSLGGSYDDAFVFKLTAVGEVLWRRGLSVTTMDYGDIDEASGGAIVAITQSPYKAVLWRLNGDGSTAWKYQYGEYPNSVFEAVQHTSDGGFVVAGRTSGTGSGGSWVLKLDANGAVVWQNTYHGSMSENIRSIRQTQDGGYIAVGRADYGGAVYGGWVLKLKEDGSLDWSKLIALGDDDEFRSVIQNYNGDYLIAGYSKIYDPYTERSWAVLLNSTGEPVWQRLYDSGDGLSGVDLAHPGGYILSAVGSDATLFRTGPGGYVEDCEAPSLAEGLVSDYPVTVQVSDASPQAISANAGSFNSYIADGALVRTTVCPLASSVVSVGITDGSCESDR